MTWRLVRLARDAALLQRELAPYRDELTGVGMTELPPQIAPDYVAARVEQYAGLLPGEPRRLADDVRARLRVRTFPSYDGGPRRSPRSGCRSPSTTTTCTETRVRTWTGS